MDPQAVTVGARLGRKINVLIAAAAMHTPDKVNFFAGVISSVVGAIAGFVGPQTAAELLRITLASLERKGEEPAAAPVPSVEP